MTLYLLFYHLLSSLLQQTELLLHTDDLSLFEQEALKHYNQTVAQKQMLAFAEEYAELDDEVRQKQRRVLL